MEYEVKQKLTLDDYLAYVNYQLVSYFFRPLNLAMYILIVVYAIYTVITIQNYFVIVILAALGGLNYLMIFTTRRRARKFYESNDSMIEMNLVFQEDKLVYRNNDGELTKFWYEFTSVKETEKYVFLSMKGQGGLIVCKESAPDGAVPFLKDCISKNMNPKKVKFQ